MLLIRTYLSPFTSYKHILKIYNGTLFCMQVANYSGLWEPQSDGTLKKMCVCILS